MMKSGKAFLVVDSVEDAVKFYTNKLGFDIVDLTVMESGRSLSYAELRKGKCYILFRTPYVDELVEFSQIKYCMSRGSGIYAEMKKGIEKFFTRCRKKGVQVIEELKDQSWGHKTFLIKDPFGFKIRFAQAIENFTNVNPNNFCGMKVNPENGDAVIDTMIRQLKAFGLSRRASKKYAKAWIKNRSK